jgi:hypothetical protein
MELMFVPVSSNLLAVAQPAAVQAERYSGWVMDVTAQAVRRKGVNVTSRVLGE